MSNTPIVSQAPGRLWQSPASAVRWRLEMKQNIGTYWEPRLRSADILGNIGTIDILSHAGVCSWVRDSFGEHPSTPQGVPQ